MKCPKKGFHPIILMALVDADYKFVWVEAGNHGPEGDAQVFNNGELKEAIDHNSINFPAPDAMTNDDQPMPYFIAADDAFALRSWLMKPFSPRGMTDAQMIFKYRLSRARRIVDNAFGILAHRFRCLLTTLQQTPITATSILIDCVCLHNLLRATKSMRPTRRTRNIESFQECGAKTLHSPMGRQVSRTTPQAVRPRTPGDVILEKSEVRNDELVPL